MDNIIMLFLCLAIGVALRWSRRMPDNAPTSLNAIIINVSLPALIIAQLHSVVLDPRLLFAALMPWLLFAGSALLLWQVGRALRLPRATTGALVVLGGLGNTSFVGLPMIEAFFGPAGMPVGIIIDQLGTYLVLSTIGIVLICFFAEGGTVARGEMCRRIATFPPLLALIVAVMLIPVPFPGWATSIATRLGGTVAPLALVSVGLQLRIASLRGNSRPLALAAGYKLVLGPLLVLLLYAGIFGWRGETMRITVFESAMGPQIGASIVAIQYGLDAKLITLVVGVGTVLSFVTLPLWWRTFQLVGLN